MLNIKLDYQFNQYVNKCKMTQATEMLDNRETNHIRGRFIDQRFY